MPNLSMGESCAWLVQSMKRMISLAVMVLQTASVVIDSLLIQVCIMLQLVALHPIFFHLCYTTLPKFGGTYTD